MSLLSYETRLKIDTVPLHPTVYTYKTNWAYKSNIDLKQLWYTSKIKQKKIGTNGVLLLKIYIIQVEYKYSKVIVLLLYSYIMYLEIRK